MFPGRLISTLRPVSASMLATVSCQSRGPYDPSQRHRRAAVLSRPACALVSPPPARRSSGSAHDTIEAEATRPPTTTSARTHSSPRSRSMATGQPGGRDSRHASMNSSPQPRPRPTAGPAAPAHRGVGEPPDHGRAPDQPATRASQQGPQGDPGPDDDPTILLLPAASCADPAGPGSCRGSQRAAQLHPLAALLRGPQRRRRADETSARPLRSRTRGAFRRSGKCVVRRTSASMGATDRPSQRATPGPTGSPQVRSTACHRVPTTTSTRCTVATIRRPLSPNRTGAASRRARSEPSRAARAARRRTGRRPPQQPYGRRRSSPTGRRRSSPTGGRLRSAGPPAAGPPPQVHPHRPADPGPPPVAAEAGQAKRPVRRVFAVLAAVLAALLLWLIAVPVYAWSRIDRVDDVRAEIAPPTSPAPPPAGRLGLPRGPDQGREEEAGHRQHGRSADGHDHDLVHPASGSRP